MEHRKPWCRATVRDGRITLNPWHSKLVHGGPGRTFLARLEDDVAIADLFNESDDELIVSWVHGRDEETVVAWAGRVGYSRVWLSDRVVDLEVAPFDGGLASTRCPTCGSTWDDETPEFWLSVRADHHFPACCIVCNGSLTEWDTAVDVVRVQGREDEGAPGPRRARHPA
jgi:hypothetical protein